MTKRFDIDDSDIVVDDLQTGESYIFDDYCSCENCCILLNELHEENQKKDKVITHLMRIIHSNEPYVFAKAVEKNVNENAKMTDKYCNRDCIHFKSDYHWYGNEEWEEVECELGNSAIHDGWFAYCKDYDDGGKYDD